MITSPLVVPFIEDLLCLQKKYQSRSSPIEDPLIFKSVDRKLRENKIVVSWHRISLSPESPLSPIFIGTHNNRILLEDNFLLLAIKTFY